MQEQHPRPTGQTYSPAGLYRKSKQSSAEREQLILEHLPQVRLIARKIHERLPDCVCLEDLVSTGIVGLINAIDRYDPSVNVKLKTYAEYKIRGAILDSLRGLDWAPRQKRRRSRLIEAAILDLEHRFRRSPSEDEIATELGIDLAEYHAWIGDIRSLTIGSLEGSASEEGGRDLLRFLASPSDEWPDRILERSDLRRILVETLTRLPQVERTVLSLYYLEELTLREIAKIVGLHESRVSQLKTQAILRLRATLSKKWPIRKGI
jgi:RNA polymerase sigma factor for flagellar operon FliA